jgi:hypothetical protein
LCVAMLAKGGGVLLRGQVGGGGLHEDDASCLGERCRHAWEGSVEVWRR